MLTVKKRTYLLSTLLQHLKIISCNISKKSITTRRNTEKSIQNSKGMGFWGARCSSLGPSPLSSPEEGENRIPIHYCVPQSQRRRRRRLKSTGWGWGGGGGGGLRSSGGGGGGGGEGGEGGGGLRSKERPTYLESPPSSSSLVGEQELGRQGAWGSMELVEKGGTEEGREHGRLGVAANLRAGARAGVG